MGDSETYYSKNRERLLALAKEYRETHKEEQNLYLKEWYQRNKERILERNKTERLKNAALRPPRIPKPKKVKAPPAEKIPFIPQTYYYSPEPQYSPEQFILSFD